MIEAVQFLRVWQGARRRYYAMRYRVPEDLSLREARLAVRQGYAKQIELEDRRRKGPAPENKIVAPAENKTVRVITPADMRRRMMHRRRGKAPSPWRVPLEWEGQTAVVIGGGPSLTAEAVAFVRDKAKVIAVNDAYRLAPWAHVLYACDLKWWTWHPEAVAFAGLKVTHSKIAAQDFAGLRWMPCDSRAPGLSTNAEKLHCGKNSGYQAVNLAYLLGARRIVLLGFDMRRINNAGHWFGEHPDRIRSSYGPWLKTFETVAAQCAELGLTIINATPGSALRCFPQQSIESVFAN